MTQKSLALFMFLGCWVSLFSQTPETDSLPTITYRNGYTYIGEVRDGRQHGEGVLLNEQGDTLYQGAYRDGRKHGFGIYQLRSGDLYEGNWYADRMDGEGRMTFVNGEVYEGEWRSDRPHGEGRWVYSDSSVYEGDFVNGQRHGEGTFTRGEVTYQGAWQRGEQTGRGEITIDREDYYEHYLGEFIAGRYHGQGEWIRRIDSSEVIRYEGNWVDGRRVGEGLYLWEGRELEGDWQVDVPTGQGRCSTEAGAYEGEFRKGEFDGIGTMQYRNGDTYTGGWLEGKRHGRGVMTYRDGSRYEGQWEHGLRHGQGLWQDAGGEEREVVFKDGEEVVPEQ
jgi:hypothetical protein